MTRTASRGAWAARRAAAHAGIGHAAGRRLAEEVGDDLLHIPPLGGVGEIAGLVGPEVNPGRRYGAKQLGPLRVGALELSGKAEKLAEKEPEAGIGGMVAYRLHLGRDCLLELSGVKQFVRGHGGVP